MPQLVHAVLKCDRLQPVQYLQNHPKHRIKTSGQLQQGTLPPDEAPISDLKDRNFVVPTVEAIELYNPYIKQYFQASPSVVGSLSSGPPTMADRPTLAPLPSRPYM